MPAAPTSARSAPWGTITTVLASFLALLVAFWFAAAHFQVRETSGGSRATWRYK